MRVSCACALGAGQQLAWLRTPKSLLHNCSTRSTDHSGMLRTILAQNHHAWRLISRDPDQSDHGGHESAGPPSCFWLRRAVSVTATLLQSQGKKTREDRAGYDATANPGGSPGAR